MLIIIEPIIIILSLWGYVQQLFLIIKRKDIGTFSIFIPGTMIITNILKIFFWFISPYSQALLLQAVLLIIVNLILVKKCVQFREKYTRLNGIINNFWNWENFYQYVLFLFGLTLVLATLTIVSITYKLPFIGEILAYISTVIEFSLAIPQIISNFKNKSVEGLSKFMIALWTINDSLKTSYFLYTSQPIQFALTGMVQIVFDIILISQMIIYKGNSMDNKVGKKE